MPIYDANGNVKSVMDRDTYDYKHMRYYVDIPDWLNKELYGDKKVSVKGYKITPSRKEFVRKSEKEVKQECIKKYTNPIDNLDLE